MDRAKTMRWVDPVMDRLVARGRLTTRSPWWGLYYTYLAGADIRALPDLWPLARAFARAGLWSPSCEDESIQPRQRSYCKAGHIVLRLCPDPLATGPTLWNRMALAFLGPIGEALPIEYLTDTVLALVQPSRQVPYLPIVADALQDAGLPENHWLLGRLRDAETPFIRSEWLHRCVMNRKRAVGRSRPPTALSSPARLH